MLANKIFIDLYFSNHSKNDNVAILLLDAGIYTWVKRKKMDDMNLCHGCFIDFLPQEKPVDVVITTYELRDKYGLRFVSPEEFQWTEKVMENERIARAFALAEQHIRNS